MNQDYIIVTEYCRQSEIEPDFIILLEESGLIQIETIENERYFHESQLRNLEKFTRLYYDLSVNIEGIDIIQHLLERIESLQSEINLLKNRINLFS